jgi:putative membrane protein
MCYHANANKYYKQLQNDEVKYSTNFMRLWNEGAQLSFAVVFLVV